MAFLTPLITKKMPMALFGPPSVARVELSASTLISVLWISLSTFQSSVQRPSHLAVRIWMSYSLQLVDPTAEVCIEYRSLLVFVVSQNQNTKLKSHNDSLSLLLNLYCSRPIFLSRDRGLSNANDLYKLWGSFMKAVVENWHC